MKKLRASRIDGVVDQGHADGVGHHAGEDAVGGEGAHGTETAGEHVLRHGAGHHRHILFGDAEADAAPQRILAAHDAIDLLGLAGEDRLHQVARADVEERGVLHGPGEPGFGGLAGGDGVAFAEDQFGRAARRAARMVV